MTGRVFEVREFCLHDGPGVRTTVFFKGCPLRCAWCHNPEGQSFEIETLTHRDGRQVTCGTDWTAPALAEELLKNADIMAQSGGGVTFSGGEPLAQAEFLAELIPLLKREGVRLAVETSGYVPETDYQRIVSQVDWVYQDIKHSDPEAFKQWCGGDLAVVLGNIAWLKASGVRHVFRVPCIPHVNDSPADRRTFQSIAGDSSLELLPFNPAAGAKYALLGRRFPLE